jgi:nucleotide-binding universal stress UspA family protein
MQDDAMKELLALKALAETSNSNANHDFDIILSTGDLNKAIKDAIKKHKINLIIMATKGVTGAQEFFFGSNTVRVISDINCPVLIVPEDYDFIEPKQIAFPTDYNRFYDTKEIKILRQLADLFDSKIRIVHIYANEKLSEIQNYNLIMLQKHLKINDYSLHWMPRYTKKVEEINDFIEELDIDLLVMVYYKHSLIEKLFREPVVKKISYQPIVPFLVIPE